MEINPLQSVSWRTAYTSQQALTAFAFIIISVGVLLAWSISPWLGNAESQMDSYEIAIPESQPHTEKVQQFTIPASKLHIVVTQGDTFVSLISGHLLSNKTAHEILRNSLAKKYLSHLKPYTSLMITLNKHKEITGLEYYFESSRKLHVWRTHGRFQASVTSEPLQPHVHFAQATINHSFYVAGAKAGISEKLLYELTHYFAWDIDFAHDLQPGDKFAVMFNDYYLGDQKVRSGDILAATFTCKGHTHKIVRYTDPDGTSGYYTPDGTSIQKAFLRAPLHYTRISSPFDLHRFHPMLHRFRKHEGVDYAAPYGTPIKATGTGKITFLGTKGGYGHTVVVQHGKFYTTVYAHMSRFRNGLHRLTHVKQGDIIGYVGSSGLATGPHVHYEFRVNGKHVDPQKTKLAQSEPILTQYRQRFIARAHLLLAQLDLYRSAALASRSDKYPIG